MLEHLNNLLTDEEKNRFHFNERTDFNDDAVVGFNKVADDVDKELGNINYKDLLEDFKANN
jgi:hypothetical protein